MDSGVGVPAAALLWTGSVILDKTFSSLNLFPHLELDLTTCLPLCEVSPSLHLGCAPLSNTVAFGAVPGVP